MNIYEGRENYIFVSYAHADTSRVLPILRALDKEGFRIWYDSGIKPGTEWPAYISQHIKDCHRLIFFVSKASVKSEYCKREITFALKHKKQILTVYLDSTELDDDLDFELSRTQAMFCNKSAGSTTNIVYELANTEILKSCKYGHIETGPSSLDKAIDRERKRKERKEKFNDLVEKIKEWYKERKAPMDEDEVKRKYSEAKALMALGKYRKAIRIFKQVASRGGVDLYSEISECNQALGRKNENGINWKKVIIIFIVICVVIGILISLEPGILFIVCLIVSLILGIYLAVTILGDDFGGCLFGTVLYTVIICLVLMVVISLIQGLFGIETLWDIYF